MCESEVIEGVQITYVSIGGQVYRHDGVESLALQFVKAPEAP